MTKRRLLEFGILNLTDIQVLIKTWQRMFKAMETDDPETYNQEYYKYILINATLDDRDWSNPEEIILQFQAPPEILDRFLSELQKAGRPSFRQEVIPELVTRCYLDPFPEPETTPTQH